MLYKFNSFKFYFRIFIKFKFYNITFTLDNKLFVASKLFEYGEKIKDENDKEEEESNLVEQGNANIQQIKNSKKYTPINSYKPSGKLVYNEDLLNKIENKIENKIN